MSPQIRKAWLLALIPLGVSLGSVLFSPPPPTEGQLRPPSTWRFAEGTQDTWRAVTFDDSKWTEARDLHVTRALVSAYPETLTTYRGTFDLDPAVPPGTNVFLMCDCVGSIAVNGRSIGTWDPQRRGQRIGVGNSSLSGFSIPAALLRPKHNLLVLELQRPPRILVLGNAAILEPYFVRLTDVKRALHLGPNFLLLLLSVLFLRLSMLVDDARYQRVYRSAVLMALGSVVLADLRVGLVQNWPESSTWVVRYYYLLFCLASIYYYEFFEDYFLVKPTAFRNVNRVITAGFALASLQLYVYNLWSFYALGLLVWGLYCVSGSPRLREQRFGPTLASALVALLLAHVLGVLFPGFHVRRVVSPEAALGLIVSAVLVLEFLNVYTRSRDLSVSLGQANTELAEALAEATEAARLKGEFVANVSHELRTPLNAIINVPAGMLSMFQLSNCATCRGCQEQFELEPGETVDATTPCPSCGSMGVLDRGEKTVFGGQSEEMVKHLKLIERSGNHLLSIVNDVLDFSKLGAGRMSLVTETFSVFELVQHVAETLKPLTTPKQLQLRVVGGTETMEILADRVKCSQVLINLVGNAIKFSPEQGSIVISYARVGSEVRIDVQDTGIGLTAEQLEYIFEPFRQAEGAANRRLGGTGLGLSIAKQIVDLHGGHISVQSTPGQGSIFSVTLPMQPRAAPVAELLPPAAPKDACIVVGEDDPVVVETIRLALSSLNVQVIGVQDPRLLLETVEREQPAVVILDVMMPRLSGLDLLKRLRADGRFKNLPILVSSAFDDNADVAIQHGAVWLAKPWSKNRLLEKVVQMLGRSGAGLKAVGNG